MHLRDLAESIAINNDFSSSDSEINDIVSHQ